MEVVGLVSGILAFVQLTRRVATESHSYYKVSTVEFIEFTEAVLKSSDSLYKETKDPARLNKLQQTIRAFVDKLEVPSQSHSTRVPAYEETELYALAKNCHDVGQHFATLLKQLSEKSDHLRVSIHLGVLYGKKISGHDQRQLVRDVKSCKDKLVQHEYFEALTIC
ncbi:hypothetical protein F503_04835 [Ophiostoma piceae UAMH 11346]|uniref:Uncharacterized protein n=1 Tax=Ophiostoma piceae (strain UAMH 11346) TaxID=1262450 RepID=S3BU18_OPHP1|nr:hypothetical protein F503_04835 [Ophiostoma piceae UAMH 11346]